jgi:predicted AlkP superfamily pyrophosphatase or phosphodiesterase
LNDDFHASDSEFSYLCEGFNNFLNRLASGMLKVKEAQASLPSTASPEVIQMMREYYGI